MQSMKGYSGEVIPQNKALKHTGVRKTQAYYLVKLVTLVERNIHEGYNIELIDNYEDISVNIIVNTNSQLTTLRTCGSRHHTLLHREVNPSPSSSEQSVPRKVTFAPSKETRASETKASCYVASSEPIETLLPTAVVYVHDVSGKPRSCRALLDSGSQTNFISQRLVEQLSLKITPTNIPVCGVGLSSTRALRKTRVLVKSRYNAFQAEIDCLILNRVTDSIPSTSLNPSSITIPRTVKQLADPNYHVYAPVDLLIGAGTFWDVLCVGQIRNGPNQPLLQKTLFGWVIGGCYNPGIVSNIAVSKVSTIEDRLDQDLERFWQLEECGSRVVFTKDEAECERSFAVSVRRNADGRYIVRLPVREEKLRALGQSRDIAFKRLQSLERKFKRDASIKIDYVKFMHEYLELGHMRLIEAVPKEADRMTCYLPHHAVVKQSSLTTKLRVVFDASCSTDSGISFNDALLAGPVLQHDLVSIIARFRKWKFVLNADITKMYRQVLIAEDQRSLQRILWRENPDDEVQIFELNTVTYGMVPASYLAVRTLHQLAEDEGASYPIGATVTKTDFYMDDLLTGANTEEEICQIRSEMIGLLAKGGFELRKWSSNCKQVLDGLTTQSSADSVMILEDESDISTLGIRWEPSTDMFSYEIPRHLKAARVTKREILSRMSRIFDPLGLLAPVIVTAKMLLQKIWALKIKWDESVPSNIYTEWISYEESLSRFNDVVVPRRVTACDQPVSVELHGFSDASESAYGACVYVRVTDADQNHFVRLYAAKSRVAPLKSVSLPRLKLCGALLLAKLMDKIMKASQIKVTAIRYWTDSMIVLCWLRAGATPEHLREKLWWHGPAWLSMSQDGWPQPAKISVEDLPEQRKSCLVAASTRHDCDLFERYSSLAKLIAVVAYCKRFLKNSRKPPDQQEFGRLTFEERRNSLTTLEKMVQEDAFPEELRVLQSNRELPSGSRLVAMNPFLDENGLIRVGGRLRNSQLSYAMKYPVVLPKGHPFTIMIIRQEHEGQLHAGAQATLAAKCFRSCRISPSMSQQIMGDLPSQRIMASRPFARTGVDYAGPFLAKESKRRNARLNKVYIAVYVCLATKAIHLELVGDLTTDAFIGSLKRFVARRGKPVEMFSDNGTTFVGAQKELKELHEAVKGNEERNKILQFLDEQEIRWHFIPPRGPHFGGLWEAAVKSMKHHLKRVAGEASLTQEELLTLIAQIEAVLNSRPISALSDDPSDLCALTPGHFLIGDALTSTLEPSLENIQENRLSRWQRIEQLRNHFWTRWSKEYLHQLQQRPKWVRNKG
ncbi:hypothetical protein KPH14_012604 [Odynerus spinipes]|uniref:Integrase catalytic domain-containing protein n=1 Tax=Odynerus spinipes TaxID=1348599 RepID=A0AAD9RFR4_9HYME|nr:hypothetical protein KPH14_012604 [Odynerus spinipes]